MSEKELKEKIRVTLAQHPLFNQMFGGRIDTILGRQDWYANYVVLYILLVGSLERTEQFLQELQSDAAIFSQFLWRAAKWDTNRVNDLILEMRAYRFLKEQDGFERLSLLEDRRGKTPDMRGSKAGVDYLIEVKNLVYPSEVSEEFLSAIDVCRELHGFPTCRVRIIGKDQWSRIRIRQHVGAMSFFDWMFKCLSEQAESPKSRMTFVPTFQLKGGTRIDPTELEISIQEDTIDDFKTSSQEHGFNFLEYFEREIRPSITSRLLSKLYEAIEQIASYQGNTESESSHYRSMVVVNFDRAWQGPNVLYQERVDEMMTHICGSINRVAEPSLQVLYLNHEARANRA